MTGFESMPRGSFVALAALLLTTSSSTAHADDVTLDGLEELLSSSGLLRVARMRAPSGPSGAGWTITAGATDASSWFCFETDARGPRCYVVEARALGFTMPVDPTRPYPLSLGISVELEGGDVEVLIAAMPSAGADPQVTMTSLLAGRARAAMPRVYLHEGVPPVAEHLGDIEIVHSRGDVAYASSGGSVRACRIAAGDVACTPSIRVGAPDDFLELEPDAQGPELYEVEVERLQTSATDELVHVLVFARDDSGRPAHIATIPFGGIRRTATRGGTDVVEIAYEGLEAIGRGCILIDPPERDHRFESTSGRARGLPAARLRTAGDTMPDAASTDDVLLVDVSGTWEIDAATRRLRRVERCSAPH